MTKEELKIKFLNDPFTSQITTAGANRCVEIAQDYANQESIEFAEWIHKDWWKFGSEGLWFNSLTKMGGFTSEEMYNKFKEQKK